MRIGPILCVLCSYFSCLDLAVWLCGCGGGGGRALRYTLRTKAVKNTVGVHFTTSAVLQTEMRYYKEYSIDYPYIIMYYKYVVQLLSVIISSRSDPGAQANEGFGLRCTNCDAFHFGVLRIRTYGGDIGAVVSSRLRLVHAENPSVCAFGKQRFCSRWLGIVPCGPQGCSLISVHSRNATWSNT
jgi:hypothetical protein